MDTRHLQFRLFHNPRFTLFSVQVVFIRLFYNRIRLLNSVKIKVKGNERNNTELRRIVHARRLNYGLSPTEIMISSDSDNPL